MNEPTPLIEQIVHHLHEADVGDRVLTRSIRYAGYRTATIRRVTPKRLYTSEHTFYSKETGRQLSAGMIGCRLIDPTNENVEAWRAFRISEIERRNRVQASVIRAEKEKRKTLHQWAVSTLADIESLHTKADRIAALLDRGEQFFDLRQDL